MRVFLDTNILISAALNPSGTPAAAYEKAVCYPNEGIICSQNVKELRRVFALKFPARVQSLERFLSMIDGIVSIVEVPAERISTESQIRDIADRAILRAAISADADIIVTGDNDFLESGIAHPAIMTAAEFVALG